MIAAQGACDQSLRGLREEIFFGRKPSFEAMFQLTAEVIDFHEYGARDRNRTGTPLPARDFKSLVSTYFTTRACHDSKTRSKNKSACGALGKTGGGGRDRTGVNGFAGRCITTLLPRHGFVLYRETKTYRHKRNAKTFSTLLMNKKGSLAASFFGNLEREKSLELSTSTLARLRSTN